jgi:hypothetical protein
MWLPVGPCGDATARFRRTMIHAHKTSMNGMVPYALGKLVESEKDGWVPGISVACDFACPLR